MSAPEPPSAELLDALRAVREAIDIPNAATAGDQETRDKILRERVLHAVVMLRGILDDGRLSVAWEVGYLRAWLAEHPAEGYTTWAEYVAQMERDRRAGGAS